MSKVFLVEPNPRYDLRGTRSYGELVFLCSSSLNPFDTSNTIKQIIKSFNNSKYNPAEDYLCMTGQAIMLALFLSVALNKYKEVKILLFDARESKYRSRIVGLENENDQSEADG